MRQKPLGLRTPGGLNEHWGRHKYATGPDRDDFLRKRGFSKAESGKIIEKVLMEEGRPPESIFDFVQGITRLARDKTQQDARLDMEGRAKKLLDRVG